MVRIILKIIFVFLIVSCNTESKQKSNQSDREKSIVENNQEILNSQRKDLFEVLNKFSFIRINQSHDTVHFNGFHLITKSGSKPDGSYYKFYTLPTKVSLNLLRDSLYINPVFDSNFSSAKIRFGDCSLDMRDTSLLRPLKGFNLIESYKGIEEKTNFKIDKYNFKDFTIELKFEQFDKDAFL
jgi:hypothetical protein